MFLSHTSELRAFPAGRSFVAAAEAAVSRVGDAVTDMSYFPAREAKAAHVCQEAVRAADIYVLIADFRYGSPVSDRPEVSYTGLEHDTAKALNLPRLVFLLDKTTEGPADLFLDHEFGARQDAFRARLSDSGVTIARVVSPDDLTAKLLHALTTLSHTGRAGLASVKRPVRSIPARNREFNHHRRRAQDDTAMEALRADPLWRLPRPYRDQPRRPKIGRLA